MRLRSWRRRALTGGVAVWLVVVPRLALSQDVRQVLVVVNAASPDSVRIGEHYATRRQVPPEQVLRLDGLEADPPDGIDRATFDRAINSPIAAWLARHQAQDRIYFIVLTKGIPLRINGGTDGTAASVDSELAVLYLRMTGAKVELAGPLQNPYFLGDRPINEARPFSRDAQQLYLVTRLDGFSVEDVIGLIDRGVRPSAEGRFVLDGKFSLKEQGNRWLAVAAERLTTAGVAPDRIAFNQSMEVITDTSDVLGYYSWGSNDPAIRRRTFNLSFVPGAIGGMFVSTDGRTFRPPPEGWTLPGWENKKQWHAGSPQSLAADLIAEGITGVAGHVSEPLLGNTIRPDVLFPAYLAGFTLAEAFYLAMPSVSWMTVVVGDPLCAPFGSHLRSSPYSPSTIDPDTELPRLFGERRLAGTDSSVSRDARRLVLRAESRLARSDRAGAQVDLERATEVAPGMLGAQFLLASTYEALNAVDAAIARYRLILERSPGFTLALNNIAYLLATKKGDLREALPTAERAYKLAPAVGPVIDTYGWVLFMSGEAKRAAGLLTEAATLMPQSAEVHLHLAHVRAALGDAPGAKAALARALELDNKLVDRPDVKVLLEH